MDDGLPDAADMIDVNHVSLTSSRTIFLDFDYHQAQVEFGHLRRLSLPIKNLRLIDCNSGEHFHNRQAFLESGC